LHVARWHSIIRIASLFHSKKCAPAEIKIMCDKIYNLREDPLQFTNKELIDRYAYFIDKSIEATVELMKMREVGIINGYGYAGAEDRELKYGLVAEYAQKILRERQRPHP
jgi:hypothetical protein